MEPNLTTSSNGVKTSALDFFLHLGLMVTLYATAISFLNLLFRIINKAFPEVDRNIYGWGAGSEISLPVATLIVVFPLFLTLGWLIYKTYAENPAKKDLVIRKWLIYITLFVTGIAFAGDLVTVIYKFLDGQDLTTAFVLKALSVLLVSGVVFGSCLQDVRNKVSARRQKIYTIIVICVLVATIIWGFSVFGSPKTQRLFRYDNQKITDLQNIQWQIISYWQTNGIIPADLEDLESNGEFAKYGKIIIPTDTQLEKSYEYRPTGLMNFELCADFNNENTTNQYQYLDVAPISAKESVIQNNNWNHQSGRQCFPRVIDPIAYPTQIKG